MKKITICGGGSLGHVIAGWLSAKGKAEVNMLTNRPEMWSHSIDIDTPSGEVLKGNLAKISDMPDKVIPGVDIVLLCLPGFAIREQLVRLKGSLDEGTFVGSVFSSTGFFFEAMEILEKGQPLWGFQRVPFIARTANYGHSAHLMGFKSGLNIAVEHSNEKDSFRTLMEDWFEVPIKLLNNWYEASLTNSNPLLHTSRLYTMFAEGQIYPRMIKFYEEWTEEAADLLIQMDKEFFILLDKLPVTKNYIPRILDYYESHDTSSLAAKLRSLQGLKGIMSPIKKTEIGWVADLSSRYFTEDFPYGLKYVYELVHKYNTEAPNINKVYQWGIKMIEM